MVSSELPTPQTPLELRDSPQAVEEAVVLEERKVRGPAKGGKPRSKRTTPRFSQVLITLATALSVAGMGLGGYKLTQTARVSVRQENRFLVPLRDIETTPLPVWIHTDILGEVQRMANLPDVLDTLQHGLSLKLHDAFAMHSWVREVEEVRVIHPATLRVRLSYREPIAIVHGSHSTDAVDRDGVLLPTGDLVDPRIYLKIIGVRSTPTGPAGTAWEDAALLAAVDTADALSPHHRGLGITTVDVGSIRTADNKQGSIYLLTEQGTRVKWGRAPSANYPGEVPVQDKIDRLEKYVAENGALDKPSGPYEIDISHWREVSIRSRLPNRPR